jgi:signal transduction histidine kinase
VLTIAACVMGFALFIVTRDVPVAEVYGARGASVVIAIPFATMGALLASRRPRNPIGWLFVAAGLLTALVVFAEQYATYSFARSGSSLPLTQPIAWLQNWAWVPLTACGLVYPFLLFPEGRLPSRSWRWVAWPAPLVLLAFGLTIAFAPGQLQSLPEGFVNPYGVGQASVETALSILGLPFTAIILLAIIAMAMRFRRSAGEEHEQMKWLLFAGSLTAFFLLVNLVLGIAGIAEGLLWTINALLTQASIGAIPIAAGVAVLKYRLYEIDVVINRALVFGALALFITGVFIGIVAGIGAVLGRGEDPNLALSILGTAVVAVAFQPVRDRAHRLANRLVYGRRATPERVLSELGEGIGGSHSIEDAVPKLARLVTEATRAQGSSVWLAIGSEIRRVSSWPVGERPASVALEGDAPLTLPDADRVYPVRHRGELLGALAVSLRAGETFPSAEERLLRDIASHAGLVLRNARLIAELRASRQRLVAAQDLERRRIERDLHDGAQQQLIALAVKLRLARTLFGREPSRVEAMLEELGEDASGALENLRFLARGIYPPALAEKGLGPALQSQAGLASLPVEVTTDGLARYAQEVESAVYFCVLEALQNVAKYANASRARVELAAADGVLSFIVSDDGAGFDPRAVARGAGLTNMTDRVEAIGGRLEVRSAPGTGTTIVGWVPATPLDED